MTYSKPEVEVIGDATVVILGDKSSTTDPGGLSGTPPFEIED